MQHFPADRSVWALPMREFCGIQFYIVVHYRAWLATGAPFGVNKNNTLHLLAWFVD